MTPSATVRPSRPVALPTFLVAPAVTAVRWISQSTRRVKVLAHRAYFTPSLTAASVTSVTSVTPPPFPASPVPMFFIKATNLSSRRQITISDTWVESMDRTKQDVPIINHSRPLPARLGPDDQYETWIAVSRVPEPDLGAEWRFRVKLTSGKVIKSRPNRKVRPEGFVAGGGEVYSAPLGTTEPVAVTGVNPQGAQPWVFGPAASTSASDANSDDRQEDQD